MRKLLINTPSHSALHMLLLATSLLTVNYAQADTLTLTESQKDGIKCIKSKDPDTRETYYECYQNPTGSYSATAKLSAETFEDKGISLDSLDENTELGIEIGLFAFSGSISTADPNKGKRTPTSLQGTWSERHEDCLKYNADDECTKPKFTTDGTVKITANAKGATISIAGKWDSDGNGQQVFTSACEANGTGSTTEDASIIIGDKTISWPIDISCTVKPSIKSDKNGDSYDLTNMSIKAKLAQ
ncbi:MAG: hypothetical protein ABL919_00480 [Methylococcales bacterium]|nr:hypothetical protein [Methylococcaceae bacterium]